MLAQNFHANGPLSGNHIGVIVRVDKGQSLLPSQFQRMFAGFVIGIAMQHGFTAPALHRLNLDRRSGSGHDDHRANAKLVCRQGNALGVVARRGRNDPATLLGLA